MRNSIDGTISLVIAFFLLVSTMLQLDTWIMAGIAIVALVVLAVYQFARRALDAD